MSRRKQAMGRALERQRLEKIARLQQNISDIKPDPPKKEEKKIDPKVALQQKKEKREEKIEKHDKDEKSKADIQLEQRMRLIYDLLISFDISPELVKRSMIGATSEKADEIVLDDVLLWICTNVPQHLIPRSLGGSFGLQDQQRSSHPNTTKSTQKTKPVVQKVEIPQQSPQESEDVDLDRALSREAFKESMDPSKPKKKSVEEMKAEGLRKKAEREAQRLAEQSALPPQQEEDFTPTFDYFDQCDFQLETEQKPQWKVISAADDLKWTGKFPGMLAGEYCRHQKYETPKYHDMKCQDGCYLMRATCQLNDKSKTLVRALLPEENVCFLEKQTAKNYIALRLLFELKVQRNFINSFSQRYQDQFDMWTNSSPLEIMKNDAIESVLSTKRAERKSSCIGEIRESVFAREKQTLDTQNNDFYRSEMQKEMNNKDYKNMLSVREALPIFTEKNSFLEKVSKNQIVVVSGTTGSGKSTQLPQYILESELLKNNGKTTKIYVTQPRRISAVGLSARVSEERGSKQFVGHQIRFEKSGGEKLVYCTVGVMLRKVLGNPDMEGISHLFIDEVHERDINTDFLLLLVKKLVERNKRIKIIIMSATLAVELFEKYFGSADSIRVESRIYPVEIHHLDDVINLTDYKIDRNSEFFNYKYDDVQKKKVSGVTYSVDMHKAYGISDKTNSEMIDQNRVNNELIVDLLVYIVRNKPVGCVLIFLPGIFEITNLQREILSTPELTSKSLKIDLMHSTIPLQQQKEAFTVAPKNVWKFVLATNIAETSVTIPDAKYLIDTGLVRLMSYDRSTKMQRLVLTRISKANCAQRSGRVGRVSAGECYRMYSESRENSFDTYPQPEIKRLPLESLCLQILLFGETDPVKFLSGAIDAPSESQIEKSMSQLVNMKAAIKTPILNQSGSLIKNVYSATPLGHALAALPVDVTIGKMLLVGCICGVAEEAATIAACMSVQQFIQSEKCLDTKKRFCGDSSDHIANMRVVQKYIEAERNGEANNFTRNNGINVILMKEILDTRKQFLELLKSYRYPTESVLSNCKDVITFVLCYVFYPNIVIPKALEGKTAS
ncbi:helicase, putative, partial [Entamoeba invadens IP1]